MGSFDWPIRTLLSAGWNTTWNSTLVMQGLYLAILTNSHPAIDGDLTILWEEAEAAVKLLRNVSQLEPITLLQRWLNWRRTCNWCPNNHVQQNMVNKALAEIVDNYFWWAQSPKRGIFNYIRTIEPSVSYHREVKSCSKCCSTDYSHKSKPFLQKNRQTSEQAKHY